MNSFIETLNQRGEELLNFAWPMLWQSSLLIALIFALDFLLARKIRASVHYALWLAVLVKLILPPTFALPTGAAWWLWQTKTEIKTPAIKNYSVTYDNAPQTDFVPQTIPLPAPLPSKLNVAGCLLLASIFISVILFLWLVIRWWQIARKIRGAVESEKFSSALADARLLANSNSRARLKIVEAQMSPAVCGLFRPVILLPRALAEKLSPEQLRAVLLHEIFHLRRKDVWVNCAQALLQIFYWWHPLLWLANARIRRVREEAVDDAVMLALRDDAETYAPTLLEVAKLALRRPLMSLGLVGIMESRSALRQRIERLLNFRAPKKAGVTFASLCGIFIFSAVALPMGEGPSTPAEKTLNANAITNTVISMPTNQPAVLIEAQIYQMRTDDIEKVIPNLKFNSFDFSGNSVATTSPEKLLEILKNLKLSGLQAIQRPRIQTWNGMPAEFFVGDQTNSLEFECKPFVFSNRIDLTIGGKITGATANEFFTNSFNTKVGVENSGGLVFCVKKFAGFSESNLLVVIGAQIYTSFPVQTDSQNSNVVSPNTISLTFDIEKPISLKNLTNLLIEAGVKIPPTIFFYKDNGILFVHGLPEQLKLVYQVVLKLNGFSPQNIEASTKGFLKDYASTSSAISTNLYMRTFRINADIKSELIEQTGLQNSDLSIMAREFFGRLGINWDIPKGKTVFYNDDLNLLFVKATESDLDLLERALHLLNKDAPQLHIKAWFFQVPKGTLDAFSKTIHGTNKIPAELTGILTSQNFKTILQSLEARTNVETLAEPEGVTTSGREMQMRATQKITIVGSASFTQNYLVPRISSNSMSSITFNEQTLETGPVFDSVASVLSDNLTIDLNVTTSLTNFFGYTDQSHITQVNFDTNSVSLPDIHPVVRIQTASAHVKLYDGQTLVLGKFQTESSGSENFPKNKNKELLVFVTVVIVDPAGNRVHSDDEMPFYTNGIPAADSSVNLHL